MVDERVTQLEAAHRSFVDQTVTTVRKNLQSELQQQLNGVKKSIGDSLQAMRGQLVEVQKIQEKMPGAIS